MLNIMYCGCNPTALASQKLLAEALRELMGQKAFAEISVSELCRASGISRQTFYSLFRSMENVVVFTLQSLACGLSAEPEGGDGLDCLCRCFSRYFAENREYLKLLVENDVDHLVFRSIYSSLMCWGERRPGPPERERRYAAQFLAGGLMGAAREYCTEEPPTSTEALYATLRSLLDGACFRPPED